MRRGAARVRVAVGAVEGARGGDSVAALAASMGTRCCAGASGTSRWRRTRRGISSRRRRRARSGSTASSRSSWRSIRWIGTITPRRRRAHRCWCFRRSAWPTIRRTPPKPKGGRPRAAESGRARRGVDPVERLRQDPESGESAGRDDLGARPVAGAAASSGRVFLQINPRRRSPAVVWRGTHGPRLQRSRRSNRSTPISA